MTRNVNGQYQKMTCPEPDSAIGQMVELLREEGPMSARELSHRFPGWTVGKIGGSLARWKGKIVYIARYDREVLDNRFFVRAMYAYGIKKRDAKKPPPLNNTECVKRYRQRRKNCVNSVFALGQAYVKRPLAHPNKRTTSHNPKVHRSEAVVREEGRRDGDG